MAAPPPQDTLTIDRFIAMVGAAGALIAAVAGVWLTLKDRRERRALRKPEVETTISPLPSAGWWRLDVVVRNFGTTRVEVSSLALSRFSKARLSPFDTQSAGDVGHLGPAGLPPVINPSKLAKSVPLRLSIAPAGSKPVPNANYGFIPGTVSEASGRCLLFLPASSWHRKVIIRMHSVRKMHADRRMSTKLKIIVPASASSASA